MRIHIVRCRWSRQSTRTCAGWAGSSETLAVTGSIARRGCSLLPARRSVRWYTHNNNDRYPFKLGHDCVVEWQVQQVYSTSTHAWHTHILLPIIYIIYLLIILGRTCIINEFTLETSFIVRCGGEDGLKYIVSLKSPKTLVCRYACISLNTPQWCDRYTGGGFLPPAQYISRIRCIQCSTYNKFIGAILRRYLYIILCRRAWVYVKRIVRTTHADVVTIWI